ncbi:hypothetical protein [Hymenobacter lapidiphilus]|uniref:DUF4468 domain-containing protein n=1 Tax=Hymenobacter lapidiphilus TaxID=2608003 RepID=A0A7Y7U5J7_9BACT|nr:hypothetical protein [Hymenobacter lapidiphilus]NVO30540.1 hypothetical protein [Hymenobacter lapidiphilus]
MNFVSRCFCCLLTLLMLSSIGLSSLAQAQIVPIIMLLNADRSGTPVEYRKGSYQRTNGEWKSGKWLINYGMLLVLELDKKKQDPQWFSPAEVHRFVAGTDTFITVRDITIPQGRIDAGYAQQMYLGGGYALTNYVYFRPGMAVSKSYVLLAKGTQAPVIVPTKPREFRQFMLSHVGDHPLLAKQLKGAKLNPEHAAEILKSYVLWQKNRPASAIEPNSQK